MAISIGCLPGIFLSAPGEHEARYRIHTIALALRRRPPGRRGGGDPRIVVAPPPAGASGQLGAAADRGRRRSRQRRRRAAPMRPTPHLARLPLPAAGARRLRHRARPLAADAPRRQRRGHARTPTPTTTGHERVRIHVPIVTEPGGRVPLRRARAPHGGRRGVDLRHLAARTTWSTRTPPGASTWWRTASARPPSGPLRPRRAARRRRRDGAGAAGPVPFDPAADPALESEAVNQPVVMSPWEQRVAGRLRPRGARRGRQPAAAGRRARGAARPLPRRLAGALGGPRRGAGRLARLPRAPGAARRRARPFRRPPAARQRRRGGRDRPPARHPRGAQPRSRAGEGRDGRDGREDRDGRDPRAGRRRAGPARVRSRRRPRRGGPAARGEEPPFDRPVFIVCPPRSGISLLFETLAQAPGVCTLGGESHALIEGIAGLHPAARGWDSNRLRPPTRTPEVVRRLTPRFAPQAASTATAPARPPAPARWRLLEKTPEERAAGAVPRRRPSPTPVFVYLYRDPRETVSSMLDAWRSGRFVTYPGPPRLERPPLVAAAGARDGASSRAWSSPRSSPAQWARHHRPAARRPRGAAAGALVRSRPTTGWWPTRRPRSSASAASLGLDWDRELAGAAPASRHTLTPPSRTSGGTTGRSSSR